MDLQESQLVQAVQIASSASGASDPQLSAQALAFLEQLKQSTEDCWSTGWAVWIAQEDGHAKYESAVRLFGLNLVDEFLDKKVHSLPNPSEALAFLHDSSLDYLQKEYVKGQGDQGLVFLKNKLAQTLSLLVIQTHSLNNSSYLGALLSLCTNTESHGEINALASDLVLRILHDLSLSLGSDVSLRSIRSKERLQRDALVRDEIRSHHAATIAELLWKIVREALDTMNSQGAFTNLPPHTSPVNVMQNLAQVAMAVVGDFVTWIDIGLIINMDTVPILYNALNSQYAQLRCVTIDTLGEIVSKGMKPADKLALIQGLKLEEILSSLESSTRSAQGNADESFIELREHLAKLVNTVCVELCKISDDTNGATADTRETAQAKLLEFLQLVLAFLQDEYDEPTEQVLPSIHLVLSLYKKIKRHGEALSAGLGNAHAEFITRLIALVLGKLKFDSETDWDESSLVGGPSDADADDAEEDDEQIIKFHDLRKQLQMILGAIAAMDEPLVSSTIHSLVVSILSMADQQELPWEKAELCLCALYTCGEVLSSVRGNKVGLGPHSYVQVPDEPGKGRNVRQSVSIYQSMPPNQLGELLQRLYRSRLPEHPHPVVQLQYFECIVRYSTSFLLWPEYLPTALSAFLDGRGLHNPRVGMRRRINYLFYRFVRDTRTAIPSEYVPKLLEGMQNAFYVQAALPETKQGEDPLAKATERAGAFDSQLYLFDSAGLLIAQLHQDPNTQVALLKAITQPLAEQLQQATQMAQSDPSNLQLVLQVHHLILALSTLAKGLPEYDVNRNSEPVWIPEFKSVTEQILLALTGLNQFKIIREASRGAFARIVTPTGPAVLPYIPTLIHALVNEVTEGELVDLLNFFGLINHKYKRDVHDVMDDLFMVLVNRVFSFLNQGVQGTDDLLRRAETERAYFAFINTMLSAGLDSVLVSEKNQQQLQSVLQSLVYYAENGEPMTQRTAVGVLMRLVMLWGKSNGDSSSALPGFEQFTYDAILPLVFQVPCKPQFDMSDAQSQQVLSELSALLKTIYEARHEEMIQYLTSVYLPSVQCPPNMAMELAQNVQTLDAKALKRYLASFLAESRST
ncbi:pre-tRNA nuclear export protein [Malassezia psittaci]|uniref:Exportin-T n=1 Tax=Malassezia psittaci TaxID=1821823 RepID=A0AAF0FBA4_9BASI|nr:pre-tRNA nuclear export protein [Malassezia psittaci]